MSAIRPLTLSEVNPTVLTSRLILICALCGLASVFAAADTLRLRDGRVIETDEVWERDSEIWYRQGKMISSVPKVDVLSKAVPRASAEARPMNRPVEVRVPSEIASVAASSKVSRIVLTDGTQIDADAVWEAESNVGYRLGAMHAFVERSAVERIVRDVAPAAEPVPAPSRQARFTTGHGGLDQLIARNAATARVDPLLIYLVMREESGFNHRAVSRAGARGLMQLMPATAARLGVRNIHDPAENVGAGTRYLRSLIDRFGDVRLALAAYNAGEEAVARHGNRIPPYRETVNYVRRISAAYQRATQ